MDDQGGTGRFQIIAFIIIELQIMSDSWLIYGLSYLLLYPEFRCTMNGKELDPDGSDFKKYCIPSYFCHNDDIQYTRVDDSSVSLRNWIYDFDLLCISELEISLFSMMFFFAWFLGQFIVPKFQDDYGRKKVFLLSVQLNTLTLIALLLLP